MWLQERSRTTLDPWYKSSGHIHGKTPRATSTVDYPHFYQGNMPVLKAKTPNKARESCKPPRTKNDVGSCHHRRPPPHCRPGHMCAFFFACRSCEYLKVKGLCRTKAITKGDIRFRKVRTILPHDSPEFHSTEGTTPPHIDAEIFDSSNTQYAEALFRSLKDKDPSLYHTADFASQLDDSNDGKSPLCCLKTTDRLNP